MAIGAVLVGAAWLMHVYLSKPAVLKTPFNERPLDEGERNPRLQRVSESRLRPGMPLWFHPTRSSYGKLLEVREDAVFVQWNSGGSNWVSLDHLKNAWVPEIEEPLGRKTGRH